MKPHVKVGWSLSEEQREHLALLLSEVDPDAAEDDPRFIRLLELWEAAAKPWNATPTVPAYHATGDVWVTAGVHPVLTAIRVHVTS